MQSWIGQVREDNRTILAIRTLCFTSFSHSTFASPSLCVGATALFVQQGRDCERQLSLATTHALSLYERSGVAGVGRPIAGATLDLDFSLWQSCRVRAFGVDSVLGHPDKDGARQGLSAFYTFQKLAERHLKGSCQSRQVAETDLARAPLEVRYMNLMNTRLFGKVDLPPTPFLSELPDSLAKLDANIRGHSSSIDLVEALYLVDALSQKIWVEDGSMVPVSRIGPGVSGRANDTTAVAGTSAQTENPIL